MKRKLKCNIIIVISLLLLSFNSLSQVKAFDKLEMLFDQGHYKIVNRKSNSLLDKPEYDFSVLPSFYKAISLLELSINTRWFKRNPNSIDEAIQILESLISKRNILKAHQNELIKVYEDIIAFQNSNLDIRNEELMHKYNFVVNYISKIIPEYNSNIAVGGFPKTIEESEDLTKREDLITYAEKFIGTPYVYSGINPQGFDCSGFTSYILENYGISIPRRASDQEKDAKELKLKNVQKGDFIFFNSGGGVSHVGIIIKNVEDQIEMIHASSSKGIVITNVTNSKYWSRIIHSYGTFLNLD